MPEVSTSSSARSTASSGFTLVELLVVVAVLGIVSMIAIPNVIDAIRNTRRTACHVSMKQVEVAIDKYMIEFDAPPTRLRPATLEPLVQTGCLTYQQRDSILSHLKDDRIWFYFGWTNWWMGDYEYILAYRPEVERDPWARCYMWSDGTWCWNRDDGWVEVMK